MMLFFTGAVLSDSKVMNMRMWPVPDADQLLI